MHMTMKKVVQLLKHFNADSCSENETYMKNFTSSWTCECELVNVNLWKCLIGLRSARLEIPDGLRSKVRPVGPRSDICPTGRTAVGCYVEPNRMDMKILPIGTCISFFVYNPTGWGLRTYQLAFTLCFLCVAQPDGSWKPTGRHQT